MSKSNQAFEFKGTRIVHQTDRSFDDVLQRLRSALGHASVKTIIELAQATSSAEGFAQKVEEAYVGPSGFMLFSEIDHGAWISSFGIDRRTTRWVFGNPLIAITMLRHDLQAGLFVPVEMLISEAEDRRGTTITYVIPSTLIVLDPGATALREAAEELDKKVAAFVASAI